METSSPFRKCDQVRRMGAKPDSIKTGFASRAIEAGAVVSAPTDAPDSQRGADLLRDEVCNRDFAVSEVAVNPADH